MKLKDLYKVETLDSRFKPTDPSPLPGSQPSKWRTPEYYIYCAVFLTIPFLMFKSVYDVSQPSHPNWQRYEQLLTDGWIPGRKVDNSDLQYRNFRNNVPYLAVLLVLHPVLRRTWEALSGTRAVSGQANGSTTSKDHSNLAADARLRSRTTFDLGFGLIFLTALHGFSALKVLTIVYVNYRIGTSCDTRMSNYSGLITWVFNIGILFANELMNGYRLGPLFHFLMPSTDIYLNDKNPMRTNWGAYVDFSLGGLIPKWEILFNFTVLRLIAFNFDLRWCKGEADIAEVSLLSYIAYSV